MKKVLSLLVVSALTGLLLITAAPGASADGTTYAFRMMTPNVAAATVFDAHHQPGDTIRLTGSGTFDPVAETVTGGGSFVHLGADGTVHMRGTWIATGFVSFSPFGGPRKGTQGGVLQLTTSHLDENGVSCGEGVPMTMTSPVNASAGTIGGTTTGHFDEIVSGRVTFALV
jgi:hypothetical protein